MLTLTLVGDAVISLWLTTHADRFGRRRVLVISSLLVLAAGAAFAATDWLPLLIVAGIVGVISPTGNEVGPFLAVEQAALAEVVPGRRRTATFAWYNLAGYVATATGALAAGLVGQALISAGWVAVDAYRVVVVGYAAIGLAMAVIASRLGPEIEVGEPATADGIARRIGLGRSRSVVFRLAALFSLDAFAGGFVPLSLMAFWFTLPIRREPGDARGDLLRLEPAVRGVGVVGRTDRREVRTHQHDGVHPSPLERPADARPADADATACCRRPAAPVQPQPDGRADPPVVRDGGGRARRAVGGGRV